MRDHPPTLNQLFEAARSREQAESAEQERLMTTVSSRLAQAGVVVSTTALIGEAAACTSATSSLWLASPLAKAALGLVAAGSLSALGVHLASSQRSASSEDASSRFHIAPSAAPAPPSSDALAPSAKATAIGGEAPSEGPTRAGDLATSRASGAGTARPVEVESIHSPAVGVAPALKPTVPRGSAGASSGKPDDSLAEELELLRRAQSELNAHHPEAALKLLERYFRAFPAGSLAPEARATRVRALCAAGHTSEAEREASRFARTNADSPLAAKPLGCAVP